MTKEEEKQKVLDKVRKLLALAQSPNENEAAMAADKAQSLLAEYNLEMSEVRTDSTGAEIEMDGETMTDSRPWRRKMGVMVAKVYFCGYFYTHKYHVTTSRKCGYIRGDSHTFTGERHNIVVAKLMFTYLNNAIETLSVKAAAQIAVSKRSAFLTSFRHACAGRVCQRLHERWVQAQRGGLQGSHGNTLPALANLYQLSDQRVKAFWQDKFKKGLGKSRALSTNKYDQDGLRAGREAGDKVGLDPQVSGTNTNHLLR